jgi:hypothetical protein
MSHEAVFKVTMIAGALLKAAAVFPNATERHT